MFGRKRAPRTPRWGFQIGWEDFVQTVREQLAQRGGELAEVLPPDGRVPLPESAEYETWDLGHVSETCRDRGPQDWAPLIAESLDAAFGAVVALAVPGTPPPPPVTRSSTHLGQLRAQLFNPTLAAIASPTIARRALGDLVEIVVAELQGNVQLLQARELAELGLDPAEAFAIGRRNAAAEPLEVQKLVAGPVPGATGELYLSNGIYLPATMLAAHARVPAGTPLVLAPMTWHHWLLFTLEPDATRATLATIRAMIATTIGAIDTVHAASAWLSPAAWWWPAGTAAPVVLADGGELPADLARLVGPE